MESVILLLLSAVCATTAQLLTPMSSMGMGSWGNPMWQSGMRYPGLMQTSQVSSMTYPTWRSHPLFRMAPSDKNVVSSLASDILNVGTVPNTQEVLTHMALANTNPKPYVDTIADLFYDQPKVRSVVTPMSTGSLAMGPAASAPSVASQAYMNLLRASMAMDDCTQDNGRYERGMDWLY